MARWSVFWLGVMVASISAAQQPDPDLAKLEKQRCPKPAEFAIVFSFGYGGDQMPADDATFGKLLEKLKEGGFNVVQCTFTEKRLVLCRRHGLKMMVDLQAPEHHVYKSPDKAEAVCLKLRGNADVWGYSIWNDPIGKSGEGRRRDVNNVRRWDPTHPAFIGTYRTDGMRHLVNADILGYYDFHWTRKREYHFPHLLAYAQWSRDRDAWFYSWLGAKSGQPGKGNFNRCLYSASTSIACGQKGILWFLGTEMMDRKTLEWTPAGQDVLQVNREIRPLGKELVKLGLPLAIHSTPITRTMNNDPLPEGKKEMMPPGLEKHGFPTDFWLQPVSGELVAGIYKTGKQDAVFLANHNAYVEQKIRMKLNRNTPVSLFNREKGQWQGLQVREGEIRLGLRPGGGELLRFGE